MNGGVRAKSDGRWLSLAGGHSVQGVFCTKSSVHKISTIKTMWLQNTGTINGRFYCTTCISGLQGSDVAERRRQSDMVKSSITKLVDGVCELEGKVRLTHTDRLPGNRLQHQWLTNMNGEFRTYHLGVVNLLEEEKDLENEQTALNDHDDRGHTPV